MEDGMQTSAANDTGSPDDVVAHIRRDPAMQVAVDLLQSFVRGKRLILRARGSSIPNAVAVANILTEVMLKNDARTQDITVDSEAPPGIGRMTSTIEITLVRG